MAHLDLDGYPLECDEQGNITVPGDCGSKWDGFQSGIIDADLELLVIYGGTVEPE